MSADETEGSVVTPRQKPSPFLDVDLAAALELGWPARLLEQGLAEPPATAIGRFGQLLACAIWHGAMLAEKWWPRWLEAAQRHMSVEDRLWLDMEPIEPVGLFHVGSYTRRWFADPTSQLLLLRWRTSFPEDCDVTAPDPETALAAYLDPLRTLTQTCEGKLHETLLNAATLRWRLRAPGVVVDYAQGNSPALSLSSATWHRILTGRAVELAMISPKRARSTALRSRKPSATRYQDAGYALVGKLFAILKEATKNDNFTTKANRRFKMSNSLLGLGKNFQGQSVAGHLCAWADFMLKEKKQGKQDWRYQPTSALNYLVVMRRYVLMHEASIDFMQASAESLEEYFIQCLNKIAPGSARNTLISAMLSFQRYLSECHSTLALAQNGFNAFRSETPVALGLVTSREYHKALLMAGNMELLEPRMLRIMLILGFRTGMRFNEIFGLETDDFIVPDDIDGNEAFELVVRRNSHRYTKTEMSRRILPLHLLLEHTRGSDKSELLEIRIWIDQRRRDAALTKNNKVFVNPAWPTVRPRYKDTLRQLDALLRSASGDVSVSFGTLRHSFATYLLTTMLLPNDLGCTLLPAAFTDDTVSAARRERLAGPLLGDGRIGQAAVHAVSKMCGHAPVRTTLQWYSHLLDWTLAAHVDRRTIQTGMTFSEASTFTTMTEPALAKAVQRMRRNARKSPAAVKPQGDPAKRLSLTPRPERGRGFSHAEAPSSVYLDEVLNIATTNAEKAARTAPKSIQLWTERTARRPQQSYKPTSNVPFRRLDWRHIKETLAADLHPYQVNDFARHHDYPVEFVEAWREEGRGFRSARREDLKPRHLTSGAVNERNYLDADFPPPPVQGNETVVADRIWAVGRQLTGPKLTTGLRVFRDYYDGQTNEIRPPSLAKTRAFADLLALLNLRIGTGLNEGVDVVVRHATLPGKRAEPLEKILAALSGRLSSAKQWQGRLAFRPVRKSDEGTGYGLRFGLTMLAIAVGDNDSINEVGFSEGYRDKQAAAVSKRRAELKRPPEWWRDDRQHD